LNRSACGDSVRGRTFIAEAGIHSMRTTVTLRVLCAAAPMLFSAGAIAQDANGRFTMTPTPEGFLKLDSRTGVVSQCLRQGPNYECRLIPDERAALQDEIDRLTRENADLRNRTAGLSPPSTGTAPPKAAEATPGSPQQALPSDSDVDRALSIMERVIRRFKDIIKEDGGSRPL